MVLRKMARGKRRQRESRSTKHILRMMTSAVGVEVRGARVLQAKEALTQKTHDFHRND